MNGTHRPEYNISSAGSEGPYVLVLDDFAELKKKRNRLAQRKHRSTVSRNNSAGLNSTNTTTQKNNADRQNSATTPLDTLTKSPKSMAQNQWHVSTTGLSQPVYLETMDVMSQNADLEQYFMHTSEPPFEAIPGFMARNHDPQHDIQGLTCRDGRLPPQRGESLMQHDQQQLGLPWEPKLGQPPTHTPSEMNPSQPPVQQLQSRPSDTNGADVEKLRSLNSDQFNNNNSNPTPHMLPTPSSSINSSTSFPSLAGLDLESRFKHVICAIESAGFESIDDLSLQYYTASFHEENVLYWAQSRSRSRSLPHLIASLQASSKTWSNREVQGYNQQITRAAEELFLDEFSCGRKDLLWDEGRRGSSQDCSEKMQHSASMTLANSAGMWDYIADIEASPDWRAKKTVVREKMPEIWSFLIELTQKAELKQPKASGAVYAFLLLLLDLDPERLPPRGAV